MVEFDTSRLRRMKNAILQDRKPFALKPFLRRAGKAAIARAHWPALGLLFTVGIVSYYNTATIIQINDSRQQLRYLFTALQEALSTLNAAETGQRGYLLVGEESYLEPYHTAAAVAEVQIARVDELMSGLPSQRSAFDTARPLMTRKLAELKQTVELQQNEGTEAAMRVVRTGQGNDLMEEIRVLTSQINTEILELYAKYDQETADLSTRATLWSILGTLSAAVLFVLVLRREIRERTRVEERAQELTLEAESARIRALLQSDGKIEALGQQAGALARSVETLRLQSLAHVEGEPDSVVQPPRDLADEIEILGKQARELAKTVESSRIKSLHKSDENIEALEQQARDLAQSVESSRIKTLNQSDKEIEALGQRARDLATFVESSRMETLLQSDEKIEALEQQARDLATSVESSRLQTLKQSDKQIEALGRKARDLATFVESSRVHTLMQSDGKIEALGQQARELARCVETLRVQTLNQSDGKIEALGQQARDLATFVETSRIETLNESNQEIRKLNEGLERRVVERTAQLEAANKELDSFSYSISHDLRAPLRAIDGFSRIVLEDYGAPLATEGKAYLQMVRDNTRQMGQLVDDLLAFARLGRQPLTKHTVDPGKIVRQCLEAMAKEREGRKLEIVIGDLPSCHADPALLKQVWTNLLANALKYTRKQEAARIEIGCRTEPRPAVDGKPTAAGAADTEVVYFVKDNGAGFDMKYVGKLFGVFQRLHRAADYEGTGVGLAIVQRIVNRHGGRIWAEAAINQGATFSFTLE